jgi:FtsP/CotA-like multicopper oxidase with cupredoxin domain
MTGPTRRGFMLSVAAGAIMIAASGLRPVAALSQERGRQLRRIGEIKSADGRLRATLGAANIRRRLPNQSDLTTLRHFWGRDEVSGVVWPPTGEDMNPGPTLRARVGDFVEIKFFNRIDVSEFGSDGIDHGETGTANGCEVVKSPTQEIYPGDVPDEFPNCFHGSSTANMHFHGFHVSPDGLGDNVLLRVRPDTSLAESDVSDFFEAIFERTRRGNPPEHWEDLPASLRALQERLLAEYDDNSVWQGEPGSLPSANRLLPLGREQVAAGLWPQFEIGAHPFSFRITPFPDPSGMHHDHGLAGGPAANVAGQTPGTHWYHTHVHGSTAINMLHGMAGVFVVEGESYDDPLHELLPGLVEQVMIVQQFAEFPMIMIGESTSPELMVNGQSRPVVSMQPGEVQLWRLVNGSVDAVGRLGDFAPVSGEATDLPQWKQTAQDGVQFDPETYHPPEPEPGATPQPPYKLHNFAPGNRVDLLIRAPELQAGAPNAAFELSFEDVITGQSQVLLSLMVSGSSKAMPLPTREQFPARPEFLADLLDVPSISRTITFSEENTGPSIDRKDFADGVFDQTMVLGDVEEWILVNTTRRIAHPFHIHVNPFQVIEIFDPSVHEAGKPYILPQPRPWQDTVAIPAKKGSVDGYVKIRHRFDDFTGSFVLHCHILEHEDRGMMQLVRVVPKVSLTRHH